MKSYNLGIIREINLSIINDEFDDLKQNNLISGGDVSGHSALKELVSFQKYQYKTVLNIGAGGADIINLFSYVPKIIGLDPCLRRKVEGVIEGWCENIETEIEFELVVCWGVLCFVRSLPESLVNFNSVLKTGGMLAVDVVHNTVQPLCQTVNPDSFVRYMQLFGFEVQVRLPFQSFSTHQREGFLFKKVRDFDYRYLRIPQAETGVNNYLEQRDWFLT